MAQFFENFESQALGAIPSGFASRWVTPSAGTEVVVADAGADASMGGKVFRIEGTGGGFTYERVGFEITEVTGSTRDRMAALIEGLELGSDKVPAFILRGAGASASARSCYSLWLRGGSGNFQIRRVEVGSSSTVATGTLPAGVTGIDATVNVEFSALDNGAGGVDVAATIWEIGESKPASPQLTYTDTSPLAVGWAGVGTASADDVVLAHTIGYVGVGTNDDPAPTEPVASGPSITSADNITDETQPATVTLANNTAAPTAITINGAAGSNITFVSEDTGAGAETYSYEPPLIADDDTADLVVSVDGTTAATVIACANSYDRDQLTHPATEAEYSENSLSYPNAYATTQPYEWKVIADANASVVTIDWSALEADDGFHKDVASYATPVANGSTTVTLGVFVPETGQAYQFDRTITVSDGSVVVEGEGLWRELFRDPTEELFTELFR